MDKLINPIIYIYLYKEFHVEGGMNIPHNLTTGHRFPKKALRKLQKEPILWTAREEAVWQVWVNTKFIYHGAKLKESQKICF